MESLNEKNLRNILDSTMIPLIWGPVRSPVLTAAQSKLMGKVARLKTAFEAIIHGGEITLPIFPKPKSKISTGKTRLEIAKYGVDTAELGQIPRFVVTCDNDRKPPSSIGYVGYAVKAKKAIGEDLIFSIQSSARPVFYGKTIESLKGGQSRIERMPLRIDRDGRDKKYLVFGVPSRLATGSFRAQIGIINLEWSGRDMYD